MTGRILMPMDIMQKAWEYMKKEKNSDIGVDK